MDHPHAQLLVRLPAVHVLADAAAAAAVGDVPRWAVVEAARRAIAKRRAAILGGQGDPGPEVAPGVTPETMPEVTIDPREVAADAAALARPALRRVINATGVVL